MAGCSKQRGCGYPSSRALKKKPSSQVCCTLQGDVQIPNTTLFVFLCTLSRSPLLCSSLQYKYLVLSWTPDFPFFDPGLNSSQSSGWQKKQIHAASAPYELSGLLSLFLPFVFIWFLILPWSLTSTCLRAKGSKRRQAKHLCCCRPASALCPDLARGESQMSTSTDNNTTTPVAKFWYSRKV